MVLHCGQFEKHWLRLAKPTTFVPEAPVVILKCQVVIVTSGRGRLLDTSSLTAWEGYCAIYSSRDLILETAALVLGWLAEKALMSINTPKLSFISELEVGLMGAAFPSGKKQRTHSCKVAPWEKFSQRAELISFPRLSIRVATAEGRCCRGLWGKEVD